MSPSSRAASASSSPKTPVTGALHNPAAPPATAARGPVTSFKSLLLRPRVAPGPHGSTPAHATLAHAPAPAPRAGTSKAHAAADAAHSKHEPRERDVAGDRERHARDGRRHDDALDPSARHAAQLAPPLVTPPSPVAAAPGQTAPEVRARASLEELLPQLVRKIAWAGDARRGSVRMELGAGELAGGTVTVHADDGRVRVEIATPAGADADAWKRRITERLEARGIVLDAVLVE